eukprot:3674730-Rhodomonas_salina.3
MPYAASGPEIAHALPRYGACAPTTSKAMVGSATTDEGATQCPVLNYFMVLPEVVKFILTHVNLLLIGLVNPVTSICLRARYAMSGTDLAYGPTRMGGSTWSERKTTAGMVLRNCYAMSGTDTPVTMFAALLRGCYAMSGTELCYAALPGEGWRTAWMSIATSTG